MVGWLRARIRIGILAQGHDILCSRENVKRFAVRGKWVLKSITCAVMGGASNVILAKHTKKNLCEKPS